MTNLARTAVLLLGYLGAVASQTAVGARLADYRKEIDAVDRQIVELLNKRGSIVQKVGELKREAGLPIAVPDRERQVLENIVAAGKSGPLPAPTLRRIYASILQEMRVWEAGDTLERK